LELRILKEIARCEVGCWKVLRLRRENKERELNAETVNAHGEEILGGEENDWMECDESMYSVSTVIAYCPVVLLTEYHSNETGGSREV
jgi:hypothetical protein